jgi:hypothetical protein
MNKIALEHDIALVIVHHTNKAGEVSGSTGVAGSVICIAQIRRNPDSEDECQLVSTKVRVDAPFRFALMMDDRGRWEFTEAISPTQAELGGAKRSIVNILTAQGPQVMQDLREALPGIARNTLKSALTRMKNSNIVCYRWELTAHTIENHPRCRLCDLPMTVFMPGQTTHPTCSPDPWVEKTVEKFLGTPVIPEQPVRADSEEPAGHPPEPEDIEDQEHDQEEDQEHPEVAKFPAFQELRASIAASRMKPLPCVAKVDREGLPWSLITERMDGAHQSKAWSGQAPEGTEYVAVLDRNGSFPSAMSSVPVAPNRLLHTGKRDDPTERQNLAGICQIMIAEWDEEKHGMPHPLGRLAVAGPGELVWVTSSHVEYLDGLARKGLVPMVKVYDSYLGRRNTSLFERYYKWARTVREQTAGADEQTRVAAKRSISTAIRALHPKQARSPFWRPDWHKAVVAQSAVRHWATAWRAVSEDGAALLSIGMTDEVAFAVPADAPEPKLWVPPAYRLGGAFGQVKHKEVKVDGEMIMSPLTLDQWKASRRGKRQR